jgi:glycerol uptake facilitator-like aquaporin
VTLARRLAAEGAGTALLLATVIGSGIMGERLAGGNTAIALLANSIATGGALIALILTFGSISGAHFNPLVSLAEAAWSRLRWFDVPLYAAVQVIGAFAGVAAAHLMFGEPLFSASQHARAGLPLIWSEAVATFGLICVIAGTVSGRPSAVPYAVGGYITAAYWFTASTSFANPAVTLARAASDTFAGINAGDAPGFILGQIAGAAAAVFFMRWLLRHPAGPTSA